MYIYMYSYTPYQLVKSNVEVREEVNTNSRNKINGTNKINDNYSE